MLINQACDELLHEYRILSQKKKKTWVQNKLFKLWTINKIKKRYTKVFFLKTIRSFIVSNNKFMNLTHL